ncbi:MAG: phosphoglycerate kinase, partial [Planctomycetota bacterium]
MRTLDDLLPQVKSGERILLRADLNVPLTEEAGRRTVSDDNRIQAVLPTIARLREHGASIVLCSHLGRPSGVDPVFSLQPVAKYLTEALEIEVPLAAGRPADAAAAANALAPGAVLLLENLRFHPEEKKNEPEFARELASLAHHFVNDAFGACHRAHSSIVGVAEHHSAHAGLLVQRELEVLTEIRDQPKRPFWVILGGSKTSDKLEVVKQLQDRVDGFVVG